MVILSRKLYETWEIGDNITITILEMKEEQVRIGINASKNLFLSGENVFQNRNRTCKFLLGVFFKRFFGIYSNFTDLHF